METHNELRIKRQKEKQNITIAVLAGLGLILLGALAFVWLPALNTGSAAGANKLSAIPVEVNYPAPELDLENINGKAESLVNFRGKLVLVNNWATWCPPCKAEMPTLVAFYNEHAKDGLVVIAIEAGESKDQVQKFADQYQMSFAVWLDPDAKSLDAFKNGSLPNSYVIDHGGTVRLMWTGEINREMLEKYVTPLLAEK